MKRHLQCAEQQVSRSNLTKYCACHAERLAYLVLITYETSFTGRRATGVTIQPHQILRLSRRKTRILSPHHIWNVIYSARSNRCHDPTSPNTAPATQNCIAKFLTKSLKTDETSFPMRGRSENDPTMIREWSEHDPSMKTQTATRLASEVTFRGPQKHFLYKIQRFEPNLTFKHSPSAAPATKSNTWPSLNTAPATQSNTWPSPNTAPTTKSNTHSSSSWHMKPHLQCATNQCLPTNSPNTAPATQNDHLTCGRNVRKTSETSFPIRGRSENDPSMIRAWKRKPQPASQVRWLFEIPRSIFYCKIQRTAPTTKVTLLFLTLLYLTLLILDSTLLDLTLLNLTLVTLLYWTWLYSTWLYSTWLYSTGLDSTQLDSSDSTLLDLTLLYLTLLYLTLLYWTLFYLILLYLTLL